jgi:hypothetical protein
VEVGDVALLAFYLVPPLLLILVVLRSTRRRSVIAPAIQDALGEIPTTRPNQHRVDLEIEASVVENICIAYGRFIVQPMFRRRVNAARIQEVRPRAPD